LSESFRGLGQLDRIAIKANQTPVGSEASQEFAGMATKAESAINEGLSGLRFERLQDFWHQNRSVRSSQCLSGCDNPSHIFGVLLRGFLFVFFSEVTRVLAGIADPALVGGNFAWDGVG
jgi:hypothetical protein